MRCIVIVYELSGKKKKHCISKIGFYFFFGSLKTLRSAYDIRAGNRFEPMRQYHVLSSSNRRSVFFFFYRTMKSHRGFTTISLLSLCTNIRPENPRSGDVPVVRYAFSPTSNWYAFVWNVSQYSFLMRDLKQSRKLLSWWILKEKEKKSPKNRVINAILSKSVIVYYQ